MTVADYNGVETLLDLLYLLKLCDAHLQELHIGNNSVCSIAVDTLTNLVSLSVLDVRDNKLEKLPDEIGLCQTLERLDVTNNSLTM